MGKYYTGIGSRETPGAILDIMQACAVKLGEQGWTLRSGAADGADSAFEAGCDVVGGAKEIFIAWDGFSGRFQGTNGVVPLIHCKERLAFAIAERIHPAWSRLSHGAMGLHARNCYQVLGGSLDTPSKFVLCYAKLDKRGEPKGGTRTAIKIAQEYGVEVINLYEDANIRRMEEWLG